MAHEVKSCMELQTEIGRHLELLPFSYNCSNSCCLLTKLLGYFPVAHPSLVQVYYFIPDVLTQLSGLGHCGEVGVCLIECVDRCLLYNEFKQMQLIQVMSGAQEGFLKKN
ncbi:hypothetical protein ATANTOWER_004255 [Ataeniobius toweri]|uniref:Uncharacterized protein n=1 Tax=Ataeniobius toweri TaxID=208326 RepID=A0ABU7CIA4_9TELE|nr:hypothetical protein [Ataeniobius toweri]